MPIACNCFLKKKSIRVTRNEDAFPYPFTEGEHSCLVNPRDSQGKGPDSRVLNDIAKMIYAVLHYTTSPVPL